MAQNNTMDMAGNTLAPDFLAGLMGKWPDMPMPALKAQAISNMPPVMNMTGVQIPAMSNGITNVGFSPILMGTPWQMPMPLTNLTPSDHPCQGKGGSSCGCGGSCTGVKKAFQKIEYSENYISTMQENYSQVGITQSDGNSFMATTKKLSPNKIVTTLVDSTTGREILGLTLVKNPTGDGWVKENANGLERRGVIPNGTTLAHLSIGIWVTYIVGEIYKSRSLQVNSFQSESTFDAPKNSTMADNGNNSFDNNLCIPHDLKCSSPITDFVTFTFLFCPSVTVNTHDCCAQHDINEWCGASNFFDRILKSFEYASQLAECIMKKIMSTINDQISPLDIICYIGTMILGFIGGMIYATGVYVVVAIAGMFLDEKYFPTDDRNKKSCLCGGTVPTTKCGEECHNLCGDFNKASTCDFCFWHCEFDDAGHGIKKYGTVPPGTPCCPDSSEQCTNDSGDKVSCCDKCSWKCKSHGSISEWFLIGPNGPISESENNCCKDLPPKPSPKQKCLIPL